MKCDIKLLDIFKLPTKTMVAISIATSIILFVPDHFTDKLYMHAFRDSFGFSIGVIFLISLSTVIVKCMAQLFEYIKNEFLHFKFKSGVSKRLYALDDYQKVTLI